jgi:hypothetical protein
MEDICSVSVTADMAGQVLVLTSRRNRVNLNRFFKHLL